MVTNENYCKRDGNCFSPIYRFCHDVFVADYKATIGVDFEVEKFTVLSTPYTLNM